MSIPHRHQCRERAGLAIARTLDAFDAGEPGEALMWAELALALCRLTEENDQ